MKSLFTAATGMDAQQTRIAVIANNIANMNTTAFKQARAEFQDLLYETQQAPGATAGSSAPTGLQIGSGVSVVGTQTLFTTGTLEQTASDLDLAIEGNGFLQVLLPSGELAYTRAGSLAINTEGKLVNQSGFVIQPEVSVNPLATDRRIAINGAVSATAPGETAPTDEGFIKIWTFNNNVGLQQIGRNLFKETTASGAGTEGTPGEQGFGTVRQGFLENSNVNIAEELIKMIMAQRAYELNSKVIQTSDQMLSATANLR